MKKFNLSKRASTEIPVISDKSIQSNRENMNLSVEQQGVAEKNINLSLTVKNKDNTVPFNAQLNAARKNADTDPSITESHMDDKEVDFKSKDKKQVMDSQTRWAGLWAFSYRPKRGGQIGGNADFSRTLRRLCQNSGVLSAYFCAECPNQAGKHLRGNIGKLRLRHLADGDRVEDGDCTAAVRGNQILDTLGLLQIAVGHKAEVHNDVLCELFFAHA